MRVLWQVYSVMATGLVAHFTGYTAGQDSIQRFMAASSLYEARKAVMVCALMSVPTWSFFNLVVRTRLPFPCCCLVVLWSCRTVPL